MEAGQLAVSAAPPRSLTTTERNWLWALAIVVGSALLFWLVYAAEMRWGHTVREERLVWHGLETSMRYLALSHFIVAILFMSTSRTMRRPRSWAWFGGLLLFGVGLSLAFAFSGGLKFHVAAALFYTYFLVHEFRDQAFFYRFNGDAPKDADPNDLRKTLWTVPAVVMGVIGTIFFAGAAFEIGGARRYTEAVFGDMAPTMRYVIGALPIVVMIVVAHLLRRSYAKTHAGGFMGFVRSNRPILFVFVGILVVLVSDILISGRVYAIVTLHVSGWYVFVVRDFANRTPLDPRPKAFTWPWMRGTLAGFNFLHLGMLALVMAAGVVWAYAFNNSPSQSAFWVLLSREAFPFWTIMHISVSFLPR